MIKEIEKKECEQKYLPFGFYYKVKHLAFDSVLRNLENKFKNKSEYANALKSAIHKNGLIFRKSLENLNRVEVIDAINIQFNYYNETCIDMFEWLNVTYDLIIKGLNISSELSPEIQSDFKEWFNNKIKSNNKYFEAEIVSYLIGQRNNMNSPISKQPCYHYIKDVLSKYQLTSIKATEMVNDFKGSFSLDWNKNIIPFIIDYLKSIDVTNETQQSSKEIENVEYNKRIFKNSKGFILFNKLVTGCPKVNDNFSFIFKQLQKDGYIFPDLKHREIKDFFNSEPYKITIDKIKTLNQLENPQRMALYSSVLNGNK
jgi:hypothetical protein